MSDLESFFRNTEPWIAVAAYTKYGHPESDRELLQDLSPIHRIDEVCAPLLVIHGAHDTNVPVSESQQIVHELRARGRTAEMLMFGDEGHEIVRRANQQQMTAAIADWIRAHPSAREAHAHLGMSAEAPAPQGFVHQEIVHQGIVTEGVYPDGTDTDGSETA